MTEAHPQSAPFARRERPGWVAIAFIGMCVLTAVSLYVGGVHMVHKPSLRPAIAVLPFTTVNADDDAQRFGVKIAAELTGALRNAVELRVTDQAPDVQVMGSVEGADGHVLKVQSLKALATLRIVAESIVPGLSASCCEMPTSW